MGRRSGRSSVPRISRRVGFVTKTAVALASVFVTLVTIASAQPPREARFANAAPAVGARVPDVVALDDQGHPFPLRERLEGRYSVLVFGCLT